MEEIKDSIKTSTIPTELKIGQETLLSTSTQPETQLSNGGKLRVGLFIGGASSEKEISLESGRHVYNSLDREKYEVTPIFVDEKRHLWVIDESLLWKNTVADVVSALDGASHSVSYEDLRSVIDFAFIAMHGKFAEEAFPGLFEILGIPNNGASVLGGAISMDKYRQRLILEASGVNVPKFIPIRFEDYKLGIEKLIGNIETKLGYPFMVKPSREGSSTALSKVKSRDGVEKAFNEAFKFDNLILAEEVLQGMELTTLVYGIGDSIKSLLPSQLLKGGDYLTAEEKFLPGGAQMITPPPITEELIKKVQEESIKAYKSLSLKIYSRIDSFLVGDLKTVEGSKVVILEPNNPPAMTPSTALWLQAAEAGFNATRFLDELIAISLKAHAGKTGPL